MKNKAVIVVVGILIVIACASFIYIVINGNSNETESKVQGNNTVVENPPVENQNQEEKNTQDNVTIDSKRGIEILQKINFIPNMYSNLYYDELDSYGISNNAKVLAAFIQIANKKEYTSMLQEGEEGTYFNAEDLEEVVKNIFSDNSMIAHVPIYGENSYDVANRRYILPAMGFSNLDYTVELPYKITEFKDHVEVLAYRVYVNSSMEEKEDGTVSVKDSIYYDRAMRNLIIELNNNELSVDESEQKNVISKKLKEINVVENELVSVKYTLTKVEDKLLISGYEKGI